MACPANGVLASAAMTRNTALKETVQLPAALAGRSVVLVGLMGAGKTSIGRRLAMRLGATEFLTKPFSPKKLYARTAELAGVGHDEGGVDAG